MRDFCVNLSVMTSHDYALWVTIERECGSPWLGECAEEGLTTVLQNQAFAAALRETCVVSPWTHAATAAADQRGSMCFALPASW